MDITDKAAVLAVGVGAVFLGAWYLQSRLAGNVAGAVGGALGDVAAAVPGIAADTVGGLVLGVGDVIGIPRTNETECEKALREGRRWDASFACPAGTFLGSFF